MSSLLCTATADEARRGGEEDVGKPREQYMKVDKTKTAMSGE